MDKEAELKNLEAEIAKEETKKTGLLAKLRSLRERFKQKTKADDEAKIEAVRKQINEKF